MKTKKRKKREWYFSKIMLAFLATPVVSIIETIVIFKRKELETAFPFAGIAIFDIIIAAISLYAVKVIRDRNRQNGNNRQPSGKSRLALDISGWLLVALAIKTIIICIFFLN